MAMACLERVNSAFTSSTPKVGLALGKRRTTLTSMTDPHSKLRPSERLRRFMVAGRGKKLTMGALVKGLGHRSIGILLMLLAVPTVVSIPGLPMAAIMSVGIALISLQMLIGRKEVSLPETVANRELPGKFGRKFLIMGFRYFRWIEKRMSPRLANMVSHSVQPMLGGVIALLALIIFLPIPGGNIVPGVSVFIIGAGLAIGDGIAVLVGLGASLLAVAATIGLILGGKELLTQVLGWFG